MKPRRSVSTPSCRSANSARTPSARPTSWPMTTPPSAGDSTTVGAESPRSRGDGPAEQLGVLPDAAARARTAGSRCCAAPRSGGNALRAARRIAGTGRAVRRVSACGSVVYNSTLNRTAPPDVYSQITARFLVDGALFNASRHSTLPPGLSPFWPRSASHPPSAQTPAQARRRRRPSPVRRRCGEAGARAEPRHPDRPSESADSGHLGRPGANRAGFRI